MLKCSKFQHSSSRTTLFKHYKYIHALDIVGDTATTLITINPITKGTVPSLYPQPMQVPFSLPRYCTLPVTISLICSTLSRSQSGRLEHHTYMILWKCNSQCLCTRVYVTFSRCHFSIDGEPEQRHKLWNVLRVLLHIVYAYWSFLGTLGRFHTTMWSSWQ